MEYYRNAKGQIAVLVSGGYGAGWSTWNTEELAYDERVVEFWLSKKDDSAFLRELASFGDNDVKKQTRAFFASLGYHDVYFGGFANLHIEWINPGEPFYIHEYDGSESLETYGSFTVLV